MLPVGGGIFDGGGLIGVGSSAEDVDMAEHVQKSSRQQLRATGAFAWELARMGA
jgi:hypothetical protein